MNANDKSSVVFALAVMLAALITGCAGMDNYGSSVSDNYYSTLAADSGRPAASVAQAPAPASEPVTPAQALMKEGKQAVKSKDYITAADKFKQIIDKDLCASETGDKNKMQCTALAMTWLAISYEYMGMEKDALKLYRAVADRKDFQDSQEYGVCNARLSSGRILLKEKRHDDAFRYYDAAYSAPMRDDSLCNGEEILQGLVSSAKGQKNGKRVASILKPVYYKQPTSANLKDYYTVLKQAGDKSEMNNVDKFHKRIVPLIDEWEKMNAPSSYADESAKIEYNSRRAKFYANALKGVKKLGLKGYDDYLIAQVRASREAAESVVASQRYEAEAAESRARKDAEDAAMMNMFMNILKAPRY